MKLAKKLLVIILISVCMLIMVQNSVQAADIYGQISSYAGQDAGTAGSGVVSATTTIAGAVVTVTRVVAAGVAIIMITVLAMKYMMAAPSEKADVKKHAVPYIVGAVIMFSVTGILGILQDFAGVFEES